MAHLPNLVASPAFCSTPAAQIYLNQSLKVFNSPDGEPTEEEALMILSLGDDSTTFPGIFMFVPGMPVVPEAGKGASYTELELTGQSCLLELSIG
jgi:hypothetical protein